VPTTNPTIVAVATIYALNLEKKNDDTRGMPDMDLAARAKLIMKYANNVSAAVTAETIAVTTRSSRVIGSFSEDNIFKSPNVELRGCALLRSPA
jgi:hypothetical protein